jgi:putative spermidine/putrescine transport system ATP-binding protein
MEGAENRYPAKLSGGQQQRIAVARALIFNPPVLLMDEPLGALDRKLRSRLQVELRALQRSLGITVIYVTHDQEEALAMSDRIAVMREGQIAQMGTGEALYENPTSAFVADFLGESNILRGTILSHDATGGSVRLASGLTFKYCGGDLPRSERVTLTIRPERVRILRAGAEPGIAATIKDIIHLGGVFRVLCALDDTTLISVTVLKSTSGCDWTVGQKCSVGWDWSDLKAFAS